MKILKLCNVQASDLNPNNRVCTSNRVLGNCHKGKQCLRTNKVASKDHADCIISSLEKFITSPESLLPKKEA